MSVPANFVHVFNYKYLFCGVFAAASLMLPASGQSEPTAPEAPIAKVVSETPGKGLPPVDELRVHADTIADILDMASERVERLAAEDVGTPALVEAIRQELSLSRRWNQHLGTMLEEVVDARRALGAREREAAREIANLTAAVEEARLELLALREVLKGTKAAQGEDAWLEGGVDIDPLQSIVDQVASSRPIPESLVDADDGSAGDTLENARATLAAMRASQKSAVRDVDAVRAKILEALQTLVSVRGDLPLDVGSERTVLTSGDITTWAAMIAARLGEARRIDNGADDADPTTP